MVREAMLETMRLIAISVHPSRLPGEYRFEARNELIGYIKVVILRNDLDFIRFLRMCDKILITRHGIVTISVLSYTGL